MTQSVLRALRIFSATSIAVVALAANGSAQGALTWGRIVTLTIQGLPTYDVILGSGTPPGADQSLTQILKRASTILNCDSETPIKATALANATLAENYDCKAEDDQLPAIQGYRPILIPPLKLPPGNARAPQLNTRGL